MKIVVDHGDGWEHLFEVEERPTAGKVIVRIGKRRSALSEAAASGSATTTHELTAHEAYALGSVLTGVARWVLDPGFTINQDFRGIDPDRVAAAFARDLEKAAKSNPPRDPTGRGFDP